MDFENEFWMFLILQNIIFPDVSQLNINGSLITVENYFSQKIL